MKVEDTVINDNRLEGFHSKEGQGKPQTIGELLLMQAEISFRAGEVEGYKQGLRMREPYWAGIREGIRRAYDYMKEKHYIVGYDLSHVVEFLDDKYNKPSSKSGE